MGNVEKGGFLPARKKFLGMGLPFQYSAVRECHAFELSGVILLPAWLRFRIFPLFPAPSFPFSCKEQGKTQAPA
ncbi:hypothetical protein CXT96_08625 [Akkermansia muciniphila]|jgi:hypothetical protein|nr:hypothetical protein CXT92_05075 [Akkermansia muciniphila]PNC89351.1 hypothetical protein CXT91_11290 [Akkermansia muciniphila]PND13486.1 hypothetical protein CXT96_08625 [Akkermansia muciniphila]